MILIAKIGFISVVCQLHQVTSAIDASFFGEPDWETGDEIPGEPPVELLDKLDEMCEKIKKPVKVTQKKLKSDNGYKQFAKILDQSLRNNKESSSEEELQEVGDTGLRMVPVDPFTNKEIVNPVRNTQCNHLYDRDGIKAYMESRQRARYESKLAILSFEP